MFKGIKGKGNVAGMEFHSLLPSSASDRFCDICRSKGTRYRCAENCDFDVCLNCYQGGHTSHPVAAKSTSSSNDPDATVCHDLVENASRSRFCDICSNMGTSHHCAEDCDYDVCANCYAKGHVNHPYNAAVEAKTMQERRDQEFESRGKGKGLRPGAGPGDTMTDVAIQEQREEDFAARGKGKGFRPGGAVQESKPAMVSHSLNEASGPDRFCDQCRKQGTAYRCAQGCDYDICARCFQRGHKTHNVEASEVAAPPPPTGHALSSNRQANNFCNVCHGQGTAYRCAEGCDYDVCTRCYGNGNITHPVSEEATQAKSIQDQRDHEFAQRGKGKGFASGGHRPKSEEALPVDDDKTLQEEQNRQFAARGKGKGLGPSQGHHQLRAERSADRCCDVCRTQGTAYRCASGCDYDVCNVCYDRGNTVHELPGRPGPPRRDIDESVNDAPAEDADTIVKRREEEFEQRGKGKGMVGRPTRHDDDGVGAETTHVLVANRSRDRCCDQCHTQGTAYRCGQGCDYDICQRCYQQGHTKHSVAVVQPEQEQREEEFQQRNKGKGFVRPGCAYPATEMGSPAARHSEIVAQALAMIPRMGGPFFQSNIRELFDLFDTDRNGFISKAEFKALYESFDKMGVEDSEVDRVLSKYNMLGDDKLSFDEFSILMLKVVRW